MSDSGRVRETVVDGLFYPAGARELEQKVASLLAVADPPRTDARVVVAPHASYDYCGPAIASGFAAAAGRTIDTVVIISRVHREPSDEIALSESLLFSTPLGDIEIDTDASDELESCGTRIVKHDIPHLEEHAIEVQLPFVKALFPSARLVPILLGRSTMSTVRSLSRALGSVFGEKMEQVLFVVSSNLCARCEVDRAEREIALFRSAVESSRPETLVEQIERGTTSVCGAACLASVLLSQEEPLEPRFHPVLASPPEHSRQRSISTYYGAVSFHPTS